MEASVLVPTSDQVSLTPSDSCRSYAGHLTGQLAQLVRVFCEGPRASFYDRSESAVRDKP